MTRTVYKREMRVIEGDVNEYAINGIQLNNLIRVMLTLRDEGQSINGDKRRDLANMMWANLQSLIQL